MYCRMPRPAKNVNVSMVDLNKAKKWNRLVKYYRERYNTHAADIFEKWVDKELQKHEIEMIKRGF
jgi:predicted P-loop ATPase